MVNNGSLFKDTYLNLNFVPKYPLKLSNAINTCLLNLNIISYHAFS